MSNVDTLVKGGVIKDASQLSADMVSKINSLSADEVSHLVSAKSKLGDDDLQGHGKVMMI